MLDIIARLLVSASIMIGTVYLPALSPGASVRDAATGATAKESRACPARRDMSVRACNA